MSSGVPDRRGGWLSEREWASYSSPSAVGDGEHCQVLSMVERGNKWTFKEKWSLSQAHRRGLASVRRSYSPNTAQSWRWQPVSADKLGQLVDELTAQGHTAIAIPTDVRQQAEVARLIEQTFSHYGQIDVLINNAGQAAVGTGQQRQH